MYTNRKRITPSSHDFFLHHHRSPTTTESDNSPAASTTTITCTPPVAMRHDCPTHKHDRFRSFPTAFSVFQPLLTNHYRPSLSICPLQWLSSSRHLLPSLRTPTRHFPTTMKGSPPASSTISLDARLTNSLANRSVIVTGATGLIGQVLVSRLRTANAHVTVLARNPSRARQLFGTGDTAPATLPYDAEVDTPLNARLRDALFAADVVINLAGEPIENGRWTIQRKRQLFDSRVVGTRRLVEALKEAPHPPVLVSISAVGFYGASETATFTEESPPGKDFLASTAQAWEKAALENAMNSRTVVLRLGVVLAKGGGALEKMKPAFQAFLGGPPGGGQQWFSWVHIDDVVRLIVHACADERWTGVYNGTAPQPVRLVQFCQEFGRALGRPSWLPVPKGAVRAIMGGEAAELVLAGQQVLPKRTRSMGFVFQYKDVGSALQHLFKGGGDSSRR